MRLVSLEESQRTVNSLVGFQPDYNAPQRLERPKAEFGASMFKETSAEPSLGSRTN